MKYIEIINELRNAYVHGNTKITREDLYKLYVIIYSNNNIKTFENMIGILKQNEIIIDYSDKEYLILEKTLYKIKEKEEILYLYKIISKEYENIKTVIWNTEIINEFTQHYVMNNYVIVETEKIAIELIVTLLKDKLIKKYTIVTENMYNLNKNMFLNSEKMLIIKPLIVRAPLEKSKDGFLHPTIEKIMVDLYKDKLYEQYQGKELEKIYKNILSQYGINFKKLYSYAKERIKSDEYKQFVENIEKNIRRENDRRTNSE